MRGLLLGRNHPQGLIVLNDLFERGVAVKVLEGIAAATPSTSTSAASGRRMQGTVSLVSPVTRAISD